MNQHNPKDGPLLSKLADVSFQPVFIMGVQRSGTSILYKLLQETGFFTVTTAYDIIYYDELLYNHQKKRDQQLKNDLTEILQSGKKQTRGIDELSVSADFPEEYGFLLSRKTKIHHLNPVTVSLFSLLCQKVTFLSNNNNPILLKNPFDFAHFLFIKKQFPTAKFVFIHRKPLNTLSSQLKAMHTLFSNKSRYMALLSPWYKKTYNNPLSRFYYRLACSPSNPLRVNQLISTLSTNANTFLQDIKHLQHNTDYVSIRYEDLCNHPQKTMENILEFLGYNSSMGIDFSSYIKPRHLSPRKEILKKKKKINKELKNYLAYNDYIINDISPMQ
ncbi:MAG: sulfotransferase [Thermoplasmatota archaeon]